MRQAKPHTTATTATTQAYTQWLDVGNYSVQTINASDIKSVKTIRSLVYPLTLGETPLTSKRCDTSPLVIYNGRTYHAGEAALSYPNGSEATVKGDKTRLSKQIELLLATGCAGDINLVLTVPDPYEETQVLVGASVIKEQTVADMLTTGLVGDYTYIHNGVQLYLSVKAVTVVQEGLPAVLKARRDGHVPNHGTTVCLDIGGKTCNLLVVDDIGDVVGYMSMLGQGGIKLATALQSNGLYRTRCKRANVSVPNVERIMSAIALGRHYVGSTVAAHWEDLFTDELTRWYSSLVGDVEASLGDLDSDLTGMMLTGGNANLLHSLTDAFIPESAEQYNIVALSEVMSHA